MIISADENTEAQSGEGQLSSFLVNGGQDTLFDKFVTFAGVPVRNFLKCHSQTAELRWRKLSRNLPASSFLTQKHSAEAACEDTESKDIGVSVLRYRGPEPSDG